MQEDIGSAFEISSISYVIGSGFLMDYVEDFCLSMAHVESDQLTETFSENYQAGSLIEVFQTDSLHIGVGYENELLLELNTPFQYNGQDNLLIDIYYPDGWCYSTVFNWYGGTNRSLVDLFMPGGSASSTGNLDTCVPYMILEGTESLDQCTFGSIKIELGGMGVEQ